MGRPRSMETERLREDFHSSLAEFLLIDLDLGLTFANMARQWSHDEARKTRLIRESRKAYDAVVRYFATARLNKPTEGEIRNRLDSLKLQLEGLGETF